MSKIYKINNHLMEYKNNCINKSLDPLNPLDLPPNTVRVRTSDGEVPSKGAISDWTKTSYETATLVPGTLDVYDVYKSGTNFSNLLLKSTNVIEVLGANTSNITNMNNMFFRCNNLTTVALFDTSNVTNMSYMFEECSSLTEVPLFDTSKVIYMAETFHSCTSLTSIPLFDTSSVYNMSKMFYNCINVESGALALYRQASTQTTPPTVHSLTFYQCGKNTQTGAAELAQIPVDWRF